MKKLIILQLLIACLLMNLVSIAQTTTGVNSATASPEFLGWNAAGVTKPLDIINNSVGPIQPIDFYINTFQYMQLKANGYLGLSDTWTTFAPLNMMHQNV